MKTRYESCLSLILPTYLGIQFNQIEMYLEFQVWGILQMRFTKKKHCNFKDLIFLAYRMLILVMNIIKDNDFQLQIYITEQNSLQHVYTRIFL